MAELLAHGVTVGVGVPEAWEARNTRFDVAWVSPDVSFDGSASAVVVLMMSFVAAVRSQAALESNGTISKSTALALASTNVEKLLGVQTEGSQNDLVATQGGDLLSFSKVAAVISPRREVVDIL